MKLLLTGDWHYRSQNPISRTDNFQATLDAKLAEVGEIARREDVEAVVVPGDVFDSPSPAYSTLTALERIVRDMGKRVWAVPGNHDEHAHSLESLDRTAYGHLFATGLIHDLGTHPIEGHTAITGTGFSTTTDTDASDYLAKTKNPLEIHVAHGMLLESRPGFELRHTLLEDVARHPDCPSVLHVCHEHLGFGVKRLPRAAGGEVVFINPGALVRLSAHPGEIERMPQVCLLEIYPGTVPPCPRCGLPVAYSGNVVHCMGCGTTWFHPEESFADYGPPELWSIGHPVIETTLIPLSCARPGHEVLSRQHIEQAAEREAKMGKFLGLLSQEGEAKFLDLQSMVEGIARNERLPEGVVSEALGRIAKAREALGGKRGVAS